MEGGLGVWVAHLFEHMDLSPNGGQSETFKLGPLFPGLEMGLATVILMEMFTKSQWIPQWQFFFAKVFREEMAFELGLTA